MYLVSFTEMWERFSYWGLAAIFVLFLTAAPATGGWGWESSDALKLYGWYGGLAFALPVLGAWLANNYLGERRCILWGAILIALGHVCLTGIVLAPLVVQFFSGIDAAQFLRETGIRPGQLLAGEDVLLAIAGWASDQPDPAASSDALLAAYLLKSWTFFLGLALIVGGTGLLKPAISSIVAHLYPQGGARRDEGFAWFFVGIYLGAMAGTLITGFLGERFGWHYGLTAAGAGMALGLVIYIARHRQWLGGIGRVPARRAAGTPVPLTAQERSRLIVLIVRACFTVLYATAFYQMFGLLNLYAHDELDRRIGSFEVPTTWMQTISLCSFFVSIPALSWFWRRLALTGRNPSASYKLALGIAVLAAAYTLIAMGEGLRGGGKTGMAWLIATYLLFGVGDALVWPNQISLTSKLAPARFAALLVGSWYLCIGVGTWLAGQLGAIAGAYEFGDVFFALAGGCAAVAIALALLTPSLIGRMHGNEQEERVSAA